MRIDHHQPIIADSPIFQNLLLHQMQLFDKVSKPRSCYLDFKSS